MLDFGKGAYSQAVACSFSADKHISSPQLLTLSHLV